MLKHRGGFAARLGASSPQRARVGGASILASGGIIYAIYRAYSERGMHQLWLLYRHQLYTHNTIYQY